MFSQLYFNLFFIVSLYSNISYTLTDIVGISAKLSKVWGPGLEPHVFTMPARYFFIQAVDVENNSLTLGSGTTFDVAFDGITKSQKPCRIWTNYLDRKDGSYIVRYKLYEPCYDMRIVVQYNNEHVDKSPFKIPETVYPDDCDCPNLKIKHFLERWKCGEDPPIQVIEDLKPFQNVNWDAIREQVIKKYDQPQSISLCHYVIKNNNVYRNCYGKYVGFKMFMDSILLSLSRKIKLPDLEFFVNLGDWPLVNDFQKFPIFSWCGSTTTYDILMPTYDITESTLENMGRVMLDMLSVQGNVQDSWENRLEKGFWRGRDSNQHRLDLIDISRKRPELFNVSLTNFFFFRDKQEIYGPKSEHVSFFTFFDYKYQLALDGTVAAYRFPYLLAGGSLVFKQDSQYYEHFYNNLRPNTHYIKLRRDLSDLVEKIEWAIKHDKEAHEVALNGQKFANENLLPQHIFCYYTHLFNEFSQRINSEIKILDNMEKVQQIKQENHCDCKNIVKDEL